MFLKLTDASDGGAVWVNMDHIDAMKRRAGEVTDLSSAYAPLKLPVKETPEEISEMIWGARNNLSPAFEKTILESLESEVRQLFSLGKQGAGMGPEIVAFNARVLRSIARGSR